MMLFEMQGGQNRSRLAYGDFGGKLTSCETRASDRKYYCVKYTGDQILPLSEVREHVLATEGRRGRFFSTNVRVTPTAFSDFTETGMGTR